MNLRFTHLITAVHMTLVVLVVALGIVTGAQVAAADTSNPSPEACASGDYLVLIGSGYEGHDAAAVQDRHTTSASGVTSTDSVLDGSGYEGHAAVTTVEEPIASHGAKPR